MDRATLFNAKSTLSHCPPSNERRLIANCYRGREISVITTYFNDNVQTPLVDLLSYTFYNKLCNNYGDKYRNSSEKNQNHVTVKKYVVVLSITWR